MGFTITGINLDPAGLDQLYIQLKIRPWDWFLRHKVQLHLLQWVSSMFETEFLFSLVSEIAIILDLLSRQYKISWRRLRFLGKLLMLQWNRVRAFDPAFPKVLFISDRDLWSDDGRGRMWSGSHSSNLSGLVIRSNRSVFNSLGSTDQHLITDWNSPSSKWLKGRQSNSNSIFTIKIYSHAKPRMQITVGHRTIVR